MNIYDIAVVCHEANRAYCQSLGDLSQQPWEEAPDWQKDSACNGVEFHMANPDAGPQGSHENWMQEKLADGWVYGEVKDPETKTHPCIRPYNELPEEQRMKDVLFVSIVRAITMGEAALQTPTPKKEVKEPQPIPRGKSQ